MSDEPTFHCTTCDEDHPGPPMAYASIAPAKWYELDDAARAQSSLDGELCAISSPDGEKEFFVRANLFIPVDDDPDGDPLVFSAWVGLPNGAMQQLLERWLDVARVHDPAYDGTLANDLPGYPATIGVPVEVQTLEPGTRARAVIPPSDHPLAIDHWEGISRDRVQALAEALAHPEGPPRIVELGAEPPGADDTADD